MKNIGVFAGTREALKEEFVRLSAELDDPKVSKFDFKIDTDTHRYHFFLLSENKDWMNFCGYHFSSIILHKSINPDCVNYALCRLREI